MSSHIWKNKWDRAPGQMHWCEYCKVWTQPDPATIRGHEGGSKHQEAVKRFFLLQKQKKIDDDKAKGDLAATLEAADRAARAAMERDGMGKHLGSSSSSSSAASAATTAAYRRPPPLQPPPPPPESEFRAVYPASEDPFAPPPPSSPPPSDDEGAGAWQRRKLAAASSATGAGDAALPSSATFEVDPNTGIGGWSSISREEVEARERAREAAAAKAEDDEAKGLLAGKKRGRDGGPIGAAATSSAHHDGLGAEEGDAAYYALNPYGGKYRGIDLDAGEGEEGASEGGSAALVRTSVPAGASAGAHNAGGWDSNGSRGGSTTAVSQQPPPPDQAASEGTAASAAAAAEQPAVVFKNRALKPGQQMRKTRKPGGGDDDD